MSPPGGIPSGVDTAPPEDAPTDLPLDDDGLPIEEIFEDLRLHARSPADLASLGRFQVVSELGRGGMGRVLEARDPALLRNVAVKVVIDPQTVSDAQLGRFVAEAQITSQLEHPNIVPVYEMGATSDGRIYFVMKKVEGRSLSDVLRGLREGEPETVAAWTFRRLVNAFVQVCNAMAYAHDRGVLHRDLKPANVMLGRFGEVLVMDWGVARNVGPDAGATRRSRAPSADVAADLVAEGLLDEGGEERPTALGGVEHVQVARTLDGVSIGTLGYMSPEQARGDLELLDARSDVWSLGAVLYEILTLSPPYRAEGVFEMLYQTMEGPPPDPRERAPDRGIPADLAEVCMRALGRDREARFASAAELGEAVEACLEGTRRRARAGRYLMDAELAWTRHTALSEEIEAIAEQAQDLDAALPRWASVEEKGELFALRRRLRSLAMEQAEAFEQVVAGCEQALSHEPRHARSREVLARAYMRRFEEAEEAGEREAQRYYERRVRLYDDGRFTELLKGEGSLDLDTEPAGAHVLCRRLATEDIVYAPGPPQLLGRTPLRGVSLPMGSYLLTLRFPGRRDVRYPLWVGRGRHVAADAPIALLEEEAIGAGFVYVPAGPFQAGGDPEADHPMHRQEPWLDGFLISVFPVTMEQYAEFLTALHAQDPGEAWQRVPRSRSGLDGDRGRHWARPADGVYRVPEVDEDGDPWDPRWPVVGVSWEDAGAYCAWRGRVDGRRCALPSELQWEKAARGADGRVFPWGRGFDPSLCKMRDSREGRPMPEACGTFPTDVSPFGVRDLAGGVRDWCDDTAFDGDPGRRPVRGGAWGLGAQACRVTNRDGYAPWDVDPTIGFRLVVG